MPDWTFGGSRSVTRRDFLRLMGAIGGSTAVWQSMNALNLVGGSARPRPPELEGRGDGTSVLVVGGGCAGSAATYELMNLGYDVHLLEAGDRLGGHVFTVRQGDETHELGGERQVCEFDEDQYWDAGPWRIPSIHHATLHYCRHLGVPMEPHINVNGSAWVYLEEIDGPITGERMRIHTLQADMRGHTAELLARALDQDQLDADLTEEDRDLLISYLISEGLLSSDDLTYGTNSRRGYKVVPGAGDQPGDPTDPIELQRLLPFGTAAMQTAGGYLASVASAFQQDTMLQPVGGMDQIFRTGFDPEILENTTLRAAVKEIRQDEDQVTVVYEDLDNGEEHEMSADYCICAVPLSMLAQISADFSSEMQEAVNGVPYFASGKGAMQFSRRFWEEDEQVYGGISWLNIPEIGTVAYPNHDFFQQKGIMQAYYNFGSVAVEVSGLSPEERMEMALEQGSKLHPQMPDEYENGFSVAWHRMPFLQGAWPTYSSYARENYYPRLQEPDGRVYLAGEHLSYTTGWMEGAFQSAWMQIEKLHERVMQEQDD